MGGWGAPCATLSSRLASLRTVRGTQLYAPSPRLDLISFGGGRCRNSRACSSRRCRPSSSRCPLSRPVPPPPPLRLTQRRRAPLGRDVRRGATTPFSFEKNDFISRKGAATGACAARSRHRLPRFLGEATAMRSNFIRLSAAADASPPVLLNATGPRGAARARHQPVDRVSGHPPEGCGALPHQRPRARGDGEGDGGKGHARAPHFISLRAGQAR